MSDLISAAIDAIQKERHEAWEDLKDCTEYREGYDNGLAESMRILIDDLPSAQPTIEERKTGNWVGIDDEPCETFECDVCGFVLDDWIEGAFYNYCPNCGADMRGNTDEKK